MAVPASRAKISMMPEAERWHELLHKLQAEREAMEQRQAEAHAAKDTEVSLCKKLAAELEAQRDEAERKAQEAQVLAMKQVNAAKWGFEIQVAEYEDRIRYLEAMLAEERAARAEELRQQAALLEEVRKDCEVRLEEFARRCNADVAAANARAREAETLSDLARQRAEAEVAASRTREEERVTETRLKAEARVREIHEQKELQLEQMSQRVLQHHQAMEEALFAHGRQKSEAIAEARRHFAELEQDVLEIRAAHEAAMALKEMRLQEWQAAKEKQHAETVKHHKDLLDLEKSMHSRTMERTVERVTRHLKLGPEPTAEDEDGEEFIGQLSPGNQSEMPAGATEG